MASMDSMDVSVSFRIKREKDDMLVDETEGGNRLDDISLLPMPLPPISRKKQIPTGADNEFLRLSTMVRTVYISYLHKCLLTNYFLCCKEKDDDVPCSQLRHCADQLELDAVRSALEASLYRRNMLKLIQDIKLHTSQKKAYKTLAIFLASPAQKIDVGVQTDNSWTDFPKTDNIQSVCITSNCEELSVLRQVTSPLDGTQTEIIHPNLVYIKTASPTVNSTSFHEVERNKFSNESDEDTKMIVEMVKEEEREDDETNLLTCLQDNPTAETMDNIQSCVQNDNENSQDSLLQHMEDMFCESDDSSDLMTLIEKHSGVTKANLDKEINKMCLETDSFLPKVSSNLNRMVENITSARVEGSTTNNNNSQTAITSPVKHSFSYYKEMKKREAGKLLQPEVETAEMKQKRRANNIWFVERVNQLSKLKALMTELSMSNYRKHGRVKERFVELFGESDDEEMMPDSPICIEEHLNACKDRIAPWIVEKLMPFYNKKRIKGRHMFKTVAKHIADMLIIENTFPEQDCVSKYIETYFKNKKFIRTKQDVYL